MNKKIFLPLFGILILFIVYQKCGNKNSLDQIQIEDTELYLTLPSGIVNKEVDDFTFGIYKHFNYSDKSFVLISTHDMGIIKLPKDSSPGFHWRKEKIDGIQIIYGDVRPKKKTIFDKYFDQMLAKGVKKK